MAKDLAHALAIQQDLVALADAIKDYGFDRSYLTPDGRGYVLAVQGEGARSMDDLMTAVGQYLAKVQQPRSEKAAAKADLLRDFETWLAKQKLSSPSR
jgi:hypothetical protein